MKLAPSLHRIGSDLVNVYLVEEAGQVTVIDAGVSGLWSDLERELRSMGRTLADVRGLILTHGDTDHVGFAERLRADHGIEVFVHEADAQLARGEEKKSAKAGPMKIGPLLGFLWYGAIKGGLRTRWLTDVTPVRDGQTLELPGAPRVIHLPGHTPGSVAIHVASVSALFVGDAMTTRDVLTGRTGPGLAPFTVDRAEALETLGRLESIDARWVLPGHGPPWDGGAAEAVARVRAAARAS